MTALHIAVLEIQSVPHLLHILAKEIQDKLPEIGKGPWDKVPGQGSGNDSWVQAEGLNVTALQPAVTRCFIKRRKRRKSLCFSAIMM